MKMSVTWGWWTPRLAMWTVVQEHADHTEFVHREMTGKFPFPLWIVVRAALKWLSWCLPSVHWNRNEYGARFLAAYVNVVSGPYTCSFCGRATKQGADQVRRIPAHCGRMACIGSAYPETT